MTQFLHFLTQIPLIIWCLIAVMLGWTLFRSLGMARQSRDLCGAFQDLAELIGEGEDHRGMAPERLEAIRVRAGELAPEVGDWWRRLERHLEGYSGGGPAKTYVLARPAREVLPEGELFEALYHGAQYQALPGIITSLGLAGTFLAILMGLFHVSYNPADLSQPVQGIDQLINNLSGKFASSLIALSLSIAFIVLEKRCERRNRLAYDSLIKNTERALPLLTPVRVLVDLQGSALRQEAALQGLRRAMAEDIKRAFIQDVNPDLSARISRSLVEGLQPTLLRMTTTLGSLETSRQDTVTKELETLIQGMQASLQEGLQGMGRDFHEALTGSARLDLEGIQQSMEGTRRVLDQLSHSFSQVQTGFSGALDTQVESLSRTVDRLGQRLEQMGSRMVESMGTAQRSAQQQAQDTMAQLGDQAVQTHQELGTLVRTVAEGAREFASASDRLIAAQRSLDGSLSTHMEGLRLMREVESQRTALQGLQGEQTAKLGQLMEDIIRVQQGGGALLQGYTETFNGTRQHLGALDQDLARAFAVIHTGMATWTSSVDQTLRSLTTETNDHFATLSRTFSCQVDDLGEKLEGLTESLDRVVEGLRDTPTGARA